MASEEGWTYSEMSSELSGMQANGGFSALLSPPEEGFFMGNSEEDALMMDRPFLDFINEMLMDEAMEDRTFAQQDCVSYQTIVNGFYDILDQHSVPVPDGEVGSLYDISDERSASWQSSSPGENGDEQSTPSFSSEKLSAPTSNSCNSDELFGLESPDVVNGFYHIISEHSSVIQSPCNSDHFNAFTNISGSSNELVRLDSRDSKAPNTEFGWINHVLNSSPATPVIADHDNSHISSAENKDLNPCNGRVSFVKNKDLDVEADYERLYVDNEDKHIYKGKQNNGLREDTRHYGRASNKGINGRADDKLRNRHADANGKKGTAAERVSGKHKGNSNGKLQLCVTLDLKELLVSCAQAVAGGDGRRADDILQQLRESGAAANGNGLHRTLHYFCKALEARMYGTGSRLYSDAAYKDRPSTAELLKALKTAFSFIPHSKIAHYFANQSILKAAEGAARLHIVDYGIFYGLQWPCLINALADRKGGPPKLIITGIEFPQPGPNPTEGLDDIGHRLTEYAKTYKVPFEYHAIAASKWEDANPISEDPQYGRPVFVVNCMNRLEHVLDECTNASSSSTSSHRQRLLDTICNLKPDLFLVAVVNANHNSPFFISRFRDALNYYSSKFDMMDTTWDDGPERMIVERDCMYRDMLNVVACEGVERVERPENYRQWQARIQRAGFEHVPIMPSVLSRAKSHVQNYYHKEFTVDHDSNRWMLLSWKGRPTKAISAWKPRAT